jgi:hypothetical protein
MHTGARESLMAQVILEDDGGIVIPADILAQAGLKPGQLLRVEGCNYYIRLIEAQSEPREDGARHESR